MSLIPAGGGAVDMYQRPVSEIISSDFSVSPSVTAPVYQEIVSVSGSGVLCAAIFTNSDPNYYSVVRVVSDGAVVYEESFRGGTRNFVRSMSQFSEKDSIAFFASPPFRFEGSLVVQAARLSASAVTVSGTLKIRVDAQ